MLRCRSCNGICDAADIRNGVCDECRAEEERSIRRKNNLDKPAATAYHQISVFEFLGNNKWVWRRGIAEHKFKVLEYRLYHYPVNPTDKGKYYGKTPIKEQAEAIVRNAKLSGEDLFIKAVCDDGIERFIDLV